jgi:hypothetical protein
MQTAIISLNSVNKLIFVMVKCGVVVVVGAGLFIFILLGLGG